jgi:hypothetical protein
VLSTGDRVATAGVTLRPLGHRLGLAGMLASMRDGFVRRAGVCCRKSLYEVALSPSRLSHQAHPGEIRWKSDLA